VAICELDFPNRPKKTGDIWLGKSETRAYKQAACVDERTTRPFAQRRCGRCPVLTCPGVSSKKEVSIWMSKSLNNRLGRPAETSTALERRW